MSNLLPKIYTTNLSTTIHPKYLRNIEAEFKIIYKQTYSSLFSLNALQTQIKNHKIQINKQANKNDTIFFIKKQNS